MSQEIVKITVEGRFTMSENFKASGTPPHRLLGSRNGNGSPPGSHHSSGSGENYERARNLKYAIVCFTVAILLFAADRLANHAPTNSSPLNSAINVRFDLFFDRPSGNSPPHRSPVCRCHQFSVLGELEKVWEGSVLPLN